MYNGIGLASVRGSGTNGYVQKNMAHVSRRRTAERKGVDKSHQTDSMLKDTHKADHAIMDHNRKRQVEAKVFALRDQLEEAGVTEDEIEAKTSELRDRLMAKLPLSGMSGSGAGGRAGETHADAAAKEAENTALKSALGISTSYVAGSSFDRELQAQRKAERIAEREAEEARKVHMEEELERERAREEKRQRKQARREEKEAARAAKKGRRDSHSN